MCYEYRRSSGYRGIIDLEIAKAVKRYRPKFDGDALWRSAEKSKAVIGNQISSADVPTGF